MVHSSSHSFGKGVVLGLVLTGVVTVGYRRFRVRRSRRRRLGLVSVATGLGLFLLSRIRHAGQTETSVSSEIPHGPVTQATVSVNPADTDLGVPGHNVQERLDEAIQETFPASEPIALHIESPW
jgi:signal transduction histidine kinase